MSRHSCQSEAMRNYGMYVTCLSCCCVFFLGGIVQCTNACPAGLYGLSCTLICPDKCGLVNGIKTCDQNTGACYNCTTGWHGSHCDYRCYGNCIDGCERNGYCANCTIGWYGSQCETRCYGNCIGSCERNGYCTNCTTGWYGSQCETRCHRNCIGGCERNGYCTKCVEGMYGTTCSEQCRGRCRNGCDKNTGTCNSCHGNYALPWCTACKDGWYGSNCDETCSANCASSNPLLSAGRCDRDTGYCSNECVEGMYGTTCSEQCSGRCRNGCDKNTGTCNSCHGNYALPWCTECVQGMYGTTCSEQCSGRCKNGCDKNAGACNSCHGNYALPLCIRCTYGWYGTSCNMQCQGICNESGCNQSTGKCITCASNFVPPECNKCIQGMYGTTCSEQCSGRCRNGCDKSTGACNFCNGNYALPLCTWCTYGWYGTSCNMQCQGICSTWGCDQSTGKCFTCADKLAPPECNRCTNGWYGTSCNMQCLGTCGTRGCNQSTGMCFTCAGNLAPPECNRCLPGWEGEYCDQKTCSDHCMRPNVSYICYRTTGHCIYGCIDGWYGSFCNMTCRGSCFAGCNQRTGKCTSCKGNFTMPECTECIQGFYGVNCTEVCGSCIHNETCSPITGLCAKGCTEGFTGNDCKLSLASDTQSATAAIVGGVIAALAVIIAVLIIVIMYRRRRRQRKNEPTEEKSGNSEPFYNNILTQEMHPGSDSTSLHVYGNISSSSSHGLQPRKMPRKNISVTNDTYSHSADKCNAGVDIHKYENVGAVASAGQPLVLKPSHDVRVSSASAKDIKTDAEDDVFEDSYDDIYNSEDIYSAYKPDNPSPQLDTLQRSLLASLASGGLSTQFELLPKGMFSSHKEGVKPANIKKNRFKALCAYDHSRVILHRPAGDPDTDYINANYIKGYKKDKAYIAAQGPRSSTVNDMWWMIWQEGITQIVMLTNLTEDGKNKCDEYWPKAGTPCTYGHVEVTNVDEEQRADFIKRSFSIKEKGTTDKRQLEQYHYVAWPDHGVPPATSLVNFWRYIKARANPNAPPLVHCSAGVGRTGTYIALDIAMDIAVDKGDVDVHNIVNNLRKDRCIMVQAEAQYKFLHEVILEAYTSHKTRLTFKRFHELFPDEINIHKSNKIIDNEYKMLQQMGEFHPKSIHDVSSSKENMKKNRNANVLPDDNHLAYLAAEGSGGNTYINATYLSSFKQRKGVILTQLPFPDTLQDFWRLVDGKEINTIVSLGSNNDVTSIKNFCQYLPKTVNESLTIGPYVINLMSSASIGSNLTSYNLSIWTEKKTWEVRLLHYTNWVGEVPDNIGEIIHLVDTLSTSRDQTDSCPLLFQCIDGASRSGLFSLSCDIVNRAVFDREIDIFQSARQVQSVRPQAVSKEVQYRYCYKLAQDYQRHMEVYQNT